MTAEEQVDELLNDLVPLVHEQLTEQGGVYPFAATLTADGEKEIVNAVEEDAEEEPENPLEELSATLTERIAAGGVDLVAVITDVTVDFEEGKGDEDAIHFAFEHKNGEAIEIFMPYTRNGDDVELGEMVAQHGVNRYFAPAAEPEA